MRLANSYKLCFLILDLCLAASISARILSALLMPISDGVLLILLKYWSLLTVAFRILVRSKLKLIFPTATFQQEKPFDRFTIYESPSVRQTHLLRWWFVVLSRQSRIIPSSCQSQVLLTHLPYSFYLLSSSFLYFYLLDRFQINLKYIVILSTVLYLQPDCLGTRGDRTCLSFLSMDLYSWAHEEIVLAFIFCFWIDLCRHTRRFCLPFFSVSGSIFFLWRSRSIVTRVWHVCPSSTLWVGWSVPLFSHTHKLLLYCQHTKLQVMKYLSHLYCEIALV